MALSPLSDNCFPDFPGKHAYGLRPTYPKVGPRSLLRRSIAHYKRCRNINLLPIVYVSRPRLRVLTNPEGTNLAQETLGFRRAGFSPAFTLLIPAESLHSTPEALTGNLQRAENAPLPRGGPGGPPHPQLRFKT